MTAAAVPARPLRFHWSLSQAGNSLRRAERREEMTGLPDPEAQLALCRAAEENGIESMLMAFGFTRPDPLLLAVVLGRRTEKVGFMVACRPGLLSPTLLVQQVNTASHLIGGRISLNLVVGHTPQELGYYGSFLGHDERYDQADELLTVCRALWRGGEVDFAGSHYRIEKGRVGTGFAGPPGHRAAPEIFLGGSSAQAARLAVRHADCLWRFAEAPEVLAPAIAPVLAAGTEVGLLVALRVRPTREEAEASARELIAGFGAEVRENHRRLARQTDSVGFSSTYRLAEGEGGEWRSRCLWTGAVPYLGPPSIALVGTPEEVTEALLEYRSIGVSQFLFLGWPDDEEMARFGREVLPRVRAAEARREAGGACL
jgi:alkanesulfonate monooxygenase